jgi:hypothetical protein
VETPPGRESSAPLSREEHRAGLAGAFSALKAKFSPPAPEPEVPSAPETPVVDEPETTARHAELQELRAELEALKATPVVQDDDIPITEEEPDQGTLSPWQLAAARDLGDDVPSEIRDTVAGLLESRSQWIASRDAWAGEDSDEGRRMTARAESQLRQIDREIRVEKRAAEQEREIRSLRSEIQAAREADDAPPAYDAAGAGMGERVTQVVMTDADLRKAVPRVAAMMDHAPEYAQRLAARIDAIPAATEEEHAAHVEALLSDLDQLLPDPPAEPASTSLAKNPASSRPRVPSSTTTDPYRGPALSSAESRRELLERFRAA